MGQLCVLGLKVPMSYYVRESKRNAFPILDPVSIRARGVYTSSRPIFFPSRDRPVYFFPYFISSLNTFDTF